MIYTNLTKKAMQICFEKHKNQTDKCGIPYPFHPFHVAENMVDEETTITALLHDVVEDTDTSFEELTKYGFSNDVIEALKLLTHSENVPYLEYIRDIKQNPIAKAVKIADLNHNSDLSRLDTITQKDIERVEKYRTALEILNT
jgi:(p)ppGpp synthase/HD superfamily hydrolase